MFNAGDGEKGRVDVGTLFANQRVGLPTYADDTEPPANTLYFDSTDGQVEYRDGGGAIHELG